MARAGTEFVHTVYNQHAKRDTVIFIRSVAETAARSVGSHKRLARFLHFRCCCEAQSEDTTVSHRNVRRACIRMPCARRLKRQRWVRWRRVVVNTWELVIVAIRTRQAVASRELRRNAASLRPMRSGQIIRDDRGERSRSRERRSADVADAAILDRRGCRRWAASRRVFSCGFWHLYGISTRFAARTYPRLASSNFVSSASRGGNALSGGDLFVALETRGAGVKLGDICRQLCPLNHWLSLWLNHIHLAMYIMYADARSKYVRVNSSRNTRLDDSSQRIRDQRTDAASVFSICHLHACACPIASDSRGKFNTPWLPVFSDCPGGFARPYRESRGINSTKSKRDAVRLCGIIFREAMRVRVFARGLALDRNEMP